MRLHFFPSSSLTVDHLKYCRLNNCEEDWKDSLNKWLRERERESKIANSVSGLLLFHYFSVSPLSLTAFHSPVLQITSLCSSTLLCLPSATQTNFSLEVSSPSAAAQTCPFQEHTSSPHTWPAPWGAVRTAMPCSIPLNLADCGRLLWLLWIQTV